MTHQRLERVSYWFDSLDSVPVPEPQRELPATTDVIIVGGGYTGLWTAYYLKFLQPDLDITVLEAVTVGFGASGRNGGWCIGAAAGLDGLLENPATRAAGGRLLRALMATVDEIGRVCQTEKIDCHFSKGGSLAVAFAPFIARHLQAEAETFAERDLGDYCHWLPSEESRRRVNCACNYGALYTPHCAAIHPARLVRGLGEAVRRRGVRVFESTPVLDIQGRKVVTDAGTLTSNAVVCATEGYTDSLVSHKRLMLPLYSSMIATEPLSESVWDDIGLRNRETFDDRRRVTLYGQRTADGRLAFGGQEVYLFGSKRISLVTPEEMRFTALEVTLKDMFPMLRDCSITHRWGGLMGVPTTWRPYVYFDRSAGFGAAGGYVGEGVAASNLAGRIMADLILGRDTADTHLPWVNDRAEKWPPEPLRWLGATAMMYLANRADRVELTRGRPSVFWGKLFSRAVRHAIP